MKQQQMTRSHINRTEKNARSENTLYAKIYKVIRHFYRVNFLPPPFKELRPFQIIYTYMYTFVVYLEDIFMRIHVGTYYALGTL